MRFYDREKETAELLRIRQLTMTDSSRMTLVTGRRRIGKTTLIQRAYADAAMVYLYVKRRNEKELVQSFCEAIRSQIDLFIPNGIAQFRDLLRLLLEYSKQHPFTLVLDEFQEFVHVNTDIFQDMQELWDTYHTQTHLNLISRGYLPARKKTPRKSNDLQGERCNNLFINTLLHKLVQNLGKWSIFLFFFRFLLNS